MFVYSNHTQFDHLKDMLSDNEFYAKNIVYSEVLGWRRLLEDEE